LARIKEAQSFGDLRENSEYEAALSEKELLENRIDQLNSLLE
jgi:transcription elongation GreA/GreB family factor